MELSITEMKTFRETHEFWGRVGINPPQLKSEQSVVDNIYVDIVCLGNCLLHTDLKQETVRIVNRKISIEQTSVSGK